MYIKMIIMSYMLSIIKYRHRSDYKHNYIEYKQKYITYHILSPIFLYLLIIHKIINPSSIIHSFLVLDVKLRSPPSLL